MYSSSSVFYFGTVNTIKNTIRLRKRYNGTEKGRGNKTITACKQDKGCQKKQEWACLQHLFFCKLHFFDKSHIRKCISFIFSFSEIFRRV